MSYGYGGRSNPYDQRDDDAGGYSRRPPPQQSFGSGPSPYGGGSRYNNQGPTPAQNQYNDGPSNVEMASYGRSAGVQSDPNAILNECRSIDGKIDQIEANLNQLRSLQERALNDADTSAGSSTSRQLDALSSETMSMYRSLTDRVRVVKSNPEARSPKNAPQVGRVDRRLKQAINSFQQVESTYRKRTQDQMARQYRIVRPDASEQEVRAAVEDTDGGAVFSQALMQSGRQGQARSVLNAVQDRKAALLKIEQQMIELAQLFQEMDQLIMQQDVAVQQIEQKGEEVVDNLDKGNEEIAVAVETARKTRKKKWICLGICVLIVIIIVVIVVVYFLVIRGPTQVVNSGGGNNNNGQKRSIEGIEFPLPIVKTVPLDEINARVSRIMARRLIGDGAGPTPGTLMARVRPDGGAGPVMH